MIVSISGFAVINPSKLAFSKASFNFKLILLYYCCGIQATKPLYPVMLWLSFVVALCGTFLILDISTSSINK